MEVKASEAQGRWCGRGGRATVPPMPIFGMLQLRWDVFNNLTGFDVESLSLSLSNTKSLGNHTCLLTNLRVVRFALRCEF
jgi:hypothetical protein